jgi:hypothetical protein
MISKELLNEFMEIHTRVSGELLNESEAITASTQLLEMAKTISKLTNNNV